MEVICCLYDNRTIIFQLGYYGTFLDNIIAKELILSFGI